MLSREAPHIGQPGNRAMLNALRSVIATPAEIAFGDARDYPEARLRTARAFSILMTSVVSLAGTSLWLWDHAIDPAGARNTIWLRALILPTGLPYLAMLLLRRSLLHATVAAFVAVLGWEVGFLLTINRLSHGVIHGQAGFMYFFMMPLLMTQGLPFRSNAILVLVTSLLPPLAALAGLVPDFPVTLYLVLVAPAACFMVLPAMWAFDQSQRATFRYHSLLQDALAAKSEFLANMSHEVRTPLTAIIGYTQFLRSMTDLPQRARSCTERILHGSEALQTIVDDILDFSKAEARQTELDPMPFSPAVFARKAVALVEPQASARGLSMHLVVQGSLPECVNADSARIRQVLLNLLANAIKFTESGSITVSAGYESATSRLLFSVADTGPGIVPEAHDRLFERFSQGDSSVARKYGGSGLGLAISKHLVELMGGTIRVESTPGVGSTFSFSVSAPVDSLTTDTRVAAASTATPESASLRAAARILVVDDRMENRELVSLLLETSGYQIAQASSGAEAIEQAGQSSFHLILMDVQMPGMDGLTATRRIREVGLNTRTPVVALSANVTEAIMARCSAAGMDGYVTKPIKLEDLLKTADRWTSGSEPRIEIRPETRTPADGL